MNIQKLSKKLKVSDDKLYKLVMKHSGRNAYVVMNTDDYTISLAPEFVEAVLNAIEYSESHIIDLALAAEKASDLIPMGKKPVVYFLFYDGGLEYIGQTINLQHRLKEHNRTKVFDKVYWDEYKQSDLILAEYVNIITHKPPMNVAGKQGHMYVDYLLRIAFNELCI